MRIAAAQACRQLIERRRAADLLHRDNIWPVRKNRRRKVRELLGMQRPI
jgi:hypothetical protein